MTLEELQAEFLKQQEELNTIKLERDNAKSELEKSKTRVIELQEHNQKLFLKLTDTSHKDEQEDKPPVSLDEYAKTLKL
jgi:uncharacterized protein (DUF3084 family)